MHGHPDMETMLREMSTSSDPRRRMLASLLEQRARADRSQAERRARTREQEKRALRFLAMRNADLAAACGACPCWGQSGCTSCHGEGVAGWRAPDPGNFTRFVEPALRRLGLLIEDGHSQEDLAPTSTTED